ncbi:unnamed protein product [Pieris brassicae]|uniref:Uncharacterized protein n=1 Tax=Pieris brassicae TaxID=7116 RepID=A0A9P0TJZ2_PIEBR|nr:unnamed protein product [Pieris brassicae]
MFLNPYVVIALLELAQDLKEPYVLQQNLIYRSTNNPDLASLERCHGEEPVPLLANSSAAIGKSLIVGQGFLWIVEWSGAPME